MSTDTASNENDASKDIDKLMDELTIQLKELYSFRNHFFELHPIDDDVAVLKTKLVEEKMNELSKKLEEIDENDIPIEHRAKYMYVKGRTYNVGQKFDQRSVQYLNKAIKLNPRLVDAWNELGECYWKNSNIKEAKLSFESALKHERDKVSLRSLSIVIRQEATNSKSGDRKQAIEDSVKLAKEAVTQDPKDGISWLILGNATLCKFFLVAQDPATLRAALSSYKQASQDPIARGQPDLYYNQGTALKYEENYPAALECFTKSCMLDPTWQTPIDEKAKLVEYLTKADLLIRTQGKIKPKKLQQMVQSIDPKAIGQYGDESLGLVPLNELTDGENKGIVAIGKVIGSIYTDNLVPFTFAITDASLECMIVNVYNWANGRGVIINDTVTIPEPHITSHTVKVQDKELKFRLIRVNNPTCLLVNGKKIGRNQVAGVTVTSTYEVH